MFAVPNLYRYALSKARAYVDIFAPFLGANRSYRKAQILAAVLFSIGTVPQLVLPWVVRYFFDVVLVHKSLTSLVYAILIYAAIQLIGVWLPFAEMMISSAFGMRAVRRLQLRCFASFFNMSADAVNRHSTGDITNRIVGDTLVATQYGTQKITLLLVAAIQLLIVVPTALFLSWQLTLIIAPLLLYNLRLQRRLKRNESALNGLSFHSNSNLTSLVYEHHSNHFLHTRGPMYRSSLRNFFEKSKENASLSMLKTVGGAVSGRINMAVGSLCQLLIWLIGALLYFHEAITIGDLLAYQAVVPMLSLNTQKLTAPFLAIRSERASAERVSELIHSVPKTGTAAIVKEEFTSTIASRNLCFRYSTSCPVLENVSFEINRGECIRLLGPNGCGKSTLLNLVMGSLLPESGTICIDGCDIASVSVKSFSRLFSYLPQNVCFFSETVKYNMQLSCDIHSQEFEEIAAALDLGKLLESLPQKIETRIGDRGIRLSGGQKQLLALVRALATPSPILILDEPCASLDVCKRAVLERCLRKENSGGRTIIVSTHDPAFLANSPALEFTGQRVVRAMTSVSSGMDYEVLGASAGR